MIKNHVLVEEGRCGSLHCYFCLSINGLIPNYTNMSGYLLNVNTQGLLFRLEMPHLPVKLINKVMP